MATTVYWEGAIDAKLKIYMYLDIDDVTAEVEGRYFYERYQKEIVLKGHIEGNTLKLREGGEVTSAILIGKFSEAYEEVGGVWSAINTSKELTWHQNRITEEVYRTALEKKGLSHITNKEFLSIIKGYKEEQRPFRITDYWDDLQDTIPKRLVFKYFGYTEEDLAFGFSEFYKGYILYESDYIGLITNYHYTPGAFGINNHFIYLYRFTYDGKLIDEIDLGCYCYDSNMGSNDYYASYTELVIGTAAITVHSKEVHATLFPEELREGEKEIYEEEKNTDFIKLKD